MRKIFNARFSAPPNLKEVQAMVSACPLNLDEINLNEKIKFKNTENKTS
jgi:hypothetical protein